MNGHDASGAHRRRNRLQSGAALIVALVMLLATTLVGVTIARVTTLQERMAGNLRQQSIAFEAAETMLREGEAWLAAQTALATRPAAVAPADCGSSPCDVLDNANPLDPMAAGTWDPGTNVQSGPALHGTAATQYYIQEQQVVPDSLNMNTSGSRVYYRVVARATSNAGGEAILRSEFAVRY